MKNEESNLEDYKTNQKDRERAGEDTDQGRGLSGGDTRQEGSPMSDIIQQGPYS
ncbi:MAG: hypothetical protein ACTHML_10530 [Ginsengibacter sp.]